MVTCNQAAALGRGGPLTSATPQRPHSPSRQLPPSHTPLQGRRTAIGMKSGKTGRRSAIVARMCLPLLAHIASLARAADAGGEALCCLRDDQPRHLHRRTTRCMHARRASMSSSPSPGSAMYSVLSALGRRRRQEGRRVGLWLTIDLPEHAPARHNAQELVVELLHPFHIARLVRLEFETLRHGKDKPHAEAQHRAATEKWLVCGVDSACSVVGRWWPSPLNRTETCRPRYQLSESAALDRWPCPCSSHKLNRTKKAPALGWQLCSPSAADPPDWGPRLTAKDR